MIVNQRTKHNPSLIVRSVTLTPSIPPPPLSILSPPVILQARVCRNLRYSLAHLKSRDKQTYLAILDSIVMGPSHISATEAEALLNINSYLFK